MIVQQVNLYRDSLKPKQISTDVYIGIAIVFVFFIGFSVINVYLIRNLRHDSKVVEQKRKVLNDEQALVTSLEAKRPKQEIDTALVAEVEQWQKKVDELNETVTTLTNKDGVGSQGFSAYFQALANQPISEVWLTKIDFDAEQQRINLEGSTFKTDKIPYFLQQLQQEPVFHGRTFVQLRIEKAEQAPLMNFKLSTYLEPAKKDHVK